MDLAITNKDGITSLYTALDIKRELAACRVKLNMGVLKPFHKRITGHHLAINTQMGTVQLVVTRVDAYGSSSTISIAL